MSHCSRHKVPEESGRGREREKEKEFNLSGFDDVANPSARGENVALVYSSTKQIRAS